MINIELKEIGEGIEIEVSNEGDMMERLEECDLFEGF